MPSSMSVRLLLLRAVPFVVGNVLVAVGAFMIFPLWGALVGAMWLVFGLLVLRARLANGARPGERRTTEEGLKGAWEFRARTILSTSFTYVFMAWLVWVLISIRGSADVGFLVAGFVLLAIDYLLLEPWVLRRAARQHGLDPADVGSDEATLRRAFAKQLARTSTPKKLLAVCGAVVAVFLGYELSRQRDVPDVTSLDVAAATTRLEDHDLAIKEVGAPNGLVCSQRPQAGHGDAHEGDTVTVVLCPP